MDSRVMFSFKFRLQYQAIEDVHLLSWLHFQWGEHTRNQLVLKQCGNTQGGNDCVFTSIALHKWHASALWQQFDHDVASRTRSYGWSLLKQLLHKVHITIAFSFCEGWAHWPQSLCMLWNFTTLSPFRIFLKRMWLSSKKCGRGKALCWKKKKKKGNDFLLQGIEFMANRPETCDRIRRSWIFFLFLTQYLPVF